MINQITKHRKHVINSVSRVCIYCGARLRDVEKGSAPQYCKGPAGIWPVPVPAPEVPEEKKEDKDSFNHQAHKDFMRGL